MSESELSASAPGASSPARGVPRTVTGFFTDVTLCIGCKACEVACKEWNEVPEDGFSWKGLSYDHTQSLGASTWRHVKFVEQRLPLGAQTLDATDPFRWVFFSDVCKHCAHAGCLEVCPTGAILRNEFGAVYVQPDVCNGCGYCVVACPFGVIGRRPDDGRAFKCTLCYDRQLADLTPACAKACPTEAIRFGPVTDLRAAADERLATVQARGYADAVLYNAERTSVGGVHAMSLVLGDPRAYGLPPNPDSPLVNLLPAWTAAAWTALGLLGALAIALA